MATPQPPYDGSPQPTFTAPVLTPDLEEHEPKSIAIPPSQPEAESKPQLQTQSPATPPPAKPQSPPQPQYEFEPPLTPWERPQNVNFPAAPPASQPEPVYQAQAQGQIPSPALQTPPPPVFDGQQKVYGSGVGGQMQPDPSKVQVVYVKEDRTRREDAALGCCAGCLAACCCCGCVVM